MNVGEICTRNVVVISSSASVIEAAQRMRREHVGDLVVVEPAPGGLAPVGIITDRDLVVGVMAMGMPSDELLLVGDIMSTDLVVAHEDDGVNEVLTRMRKYGIRRLPIVDDEGKLVGLLTFDDLVELLAEELGLLAELVPREQTLERVQRR